MVQDVRHNLAKVGVAGSNPVVRSRSEATPWPVGTPAGHSFGHSPSIEPPSSVSIPVAASRLSSATTS
jgi:hypothetical protein